MKKTLISLGIALATMTVASQASVSIATQSYQEQIVNGSTQWVQAVKVVPGTTILYQNTLTNNDATTTADNLNIVNQIPTHMEYLDSTAACSVACTVTYSVDGGTTFDVPSNLYVGTGSTRRLAVASDYTTIKWLITTLNASATESVQYKARLQ